MRNQSKSCAFYCRRPATIFQFFSSLESGCHEEKMKIAKTVLSHAILLWLLGKDFLEVYIKVMCSHTFLIACVANTMTPYRLPAIS